MEYKNESFVKTTSGRLVGIRELADRLSINKSCLYKKVLYGSIPFVMVGKRTMFDLDEIDKWVKERKVEW